MYNEMCPFAQMRTDFLADAFFPVEESIVEEPEVYYSSHTLPDFPEQDVLAPAQSRYRIIDVPAPKESFTPEEARRIGTIIGIDWSKSPFDIAQFRRGLNVELEHGRRNLQTNVTGDDPIATGKLALAHLKEFPDYYMRLKKLEDEGKAYWSSES